MLMAMAPVLSSRERGFFTTEVEFIRLFFVSLRPSELPITGVQFILEVSIGRGDFMQ